LGGGEFLPIALQSALQNGVEREARKENEARIAIGAKQHE
jgi:hypothetical protein